LVALRDDRRRKRYNGISEPRLKVESEVVVEVQDVKRGNMVFVLYATNREF
jgi:hypothetical protein